MQDDVNLHIYHMLEGTFSLDMADTKAENMFSALNKGDPSQ